MKYTKVRGMNDILPPESDLWWNIESTAREIFNSYGFQEIRVPIVERTELFTRTIGEATAIVEKEMYTFRDRNNELLALRPEGTASVIRAYIDATGRFQTLPVKLFYMGPMFRYERPQKGRYRQFHQIGVELLGTASPSADAEVIAMGAHYLNALGIKDYKIEINSLGCQLCRLKYQEKFMAVMEKRRDALCNDCRRRIEKNPLRAFDCKNEECQKVLKDAPKITEFLCKECKENFHAVQQALNVINAPFVINERIVRGLDYYMRTAFEYTTERLGAQNAVGGGGRYDGLVKSMGGPDVSGVGFALGTERIVLLIEDIQGKPKKERELIYFVLLGDKARDIALPIIQTLRMDGINVEWDFDISSMKSQMRRANRLKAHSVVIIGDDEIKSGISIVKNMHTGEQEEVRILDLPRHFVHVEV